MNEIRVTYTSAEGVRKVVAINGGKHDPFEVLERCRARMFPGVAVLEHDPAYDRAMAMLAERKAAAAEAGQETEDEAVARKHDERKDGVRDRSKDAHAKITTQEKGHGSAPLSASHNSGEVAVNHASGPHVSGVRDTSRDAYAKHGATGKLSRQQEIIVAVMRGSKRDYTRQELAKKTGLGINAVCGRVNELLQEPFFVLVEHRRRKCGITGESVMALSVREGV